MSFSYANSKTYGLKELVRLCCLLPVVYSNPYFFFWRREEKKEREKKRPSIARFGSQMIFPASIFLSSSMWYIYYGNVDLEVVIANIMGGEAYVDQDCSRTWGEDLNRIGVAFG